MHQSVDPGQPDVDRPWVPAELAHRDVAGLLDLERLGDDHFRNRRHQANDTGGVFGGQVMGQALSAASATVGERAAHSFSAYFLRPGRADRPIDFHVERRLDGRFFSVRRIVAMQDGRPILDAESSFHRDEPGHEHQRDMRAVPPPEGLLSLEQVVNSAAERLPPTMVQLQGKKLMADIRPVDPRNSVLRETAGTERAAWIRVPAFEQGQGKARVAPMLAYLSDYWLISTALLPHALPVPSPDLQIATINHAIWFHGAKVVGEWLLYECDTPVARQGRGLVRGTLHDQTGRLVATVVQEGLFRLKGMQTS